MLLGMGVVFSFLALLVLLMYASQWIFARYQPVEKNPDTPPGTGGGTNPALMPVIVSAVHRYRSGS